MIVDPDGNVSTILNTLVNFGWEYVYHCHILSHEEMDMMRPVMLAVPPLAATIASFDQATQTIMFNDNSITETSFIVQKSIDGTTWTDVQTIVSPLDQPNIHESRSVVDAGFVPDVATSYRVVALNSVGYGGAYPKATAKSVSLPFLVGTVTATTTMLTSDVNPSIFGQNVTFTATVSPAAATGTVQFSVDGANVGAPMALNASGVATYATSGLSVGSHSIAAVYSGSTLYGSSSGSLAQVVNQASTTTTLTSSLNPSPLGQSVTFTAAVAPATATGSVVFTIDGVDGAPVAVVAGKATFTTSSLSGGDHPVLATYGGNASFLGSASATLVQTVNPLAATATVVTGSPNPSVFGQSVTFTATVSPVAAGATPTGTVQFSIDSVNAGAPVALSATGVATFSTNAMLVGSHSVAATYGGSGTYATSSGTTTQQVAKAATRTTARTSDNNGRVGDQIRLTATTTVVAPGAGAPTGQVTFTLSNSKVIGTANVVNGVATLNWTPVAADIGTWTVTATYSGDANFVGSFGTIANQRVR